MLRQHIHFGRVGAAASRWRGGVRIKRPDVVGHGGDIDYIVHLSVARRQARHLQWLRFQARIVVKRQAEVFNEKAVAVSMVSRVFAPARAMS